MSLHQILEVPARDRRDHAAVIEGVSGARLSYARLDRLSDRLRDRLIAMGVSRGDRVGMYLKKSADSVATIFGILKSGAAYVPVDPTAPPSRNAFIHNNCEVKVAIVEKRFVDIYREALSRLGDVPKMIVLDAIGGGDCLEKAMNELDAQTPAPAKKSIDSAPDDLAYILYTSGSTGKPKGVMLSHLNGRNFVDWCSTTFDPQASDIFSSHAPFHFDLSILDLYVPLQRGATLVLIPEEAGKDPLALSKIISEHKITCWYSAASILSLLAQFGKIAEHDYSNLRMVFFTGEVLPIVHLRSFKKQVPQPRYFNLYGPTETNVCTYYEIPAEIPAERTDPYPIGKVCSNLEGKVVDAVGHDIPRGEEGELCIAGPNVMQGYWALTEQTSKSFLADDGSGKRWYKTGDIVIEERDGNYHYVGRRDRMVKKRGYRVELGEIEACLYQHASVREAAVIALPDSAAGVKVIAHLSVRGDKKPSLIELKTFCSQHLPVYMVPDSFSFHGSLPKTSTDKIDYQTLKLLR